MNIFNKSLNDMFTNTFNKSFNEIFMMKCNFLVRRELKINKEQ